MVMNKVIGKQVTTCNDWFKTLLLLEKVMEPGPVLAHDRRVYKTELFRWSIRSSVVFDKLRTLHTKRGTDKVTAGKLTKKMSMLYLILSVVVLMLQASRACNEQNVQQLASTRLQSDEYAYGADGAYDAYGLTPNPWVSSYYQPAAHVPGKHKKFYAVYRLLKNRLYFLRFPNIMAFSYIHSTYCLISRVRKSVRKTKSS